MRNKPINQNTHNKSKKQSGFTLLEVMIALFVVAVALGGAVKVMGNAALNSTRLSSRTFAQWVALNQVAKLQIEKAWPNFGSLDGKDKMASQEWRWVQKTIKTTDENIRRVEFSVWNKNDSKDSSPIVTIVGFLGK